MVLTKLKNLQLTNGDNSKIRLEKLWFLYTALFLTCSISLCSFKLIPFIVRNLWPEQKFTEEIYVRNQGQIILESKQRSTFGESHVQLGIIVINSRKLQIIPKEL